MIRLCGAVFRPLRAALTAASARSTASTQRPSIAASTPSPIEACARSSADAGGEATVAAAGLAATVASPSASAEERAHASMGLGVLAAMEGRWVEAVERADAAVSAARSGRNTAPQSRIMTEVAAALLRIRAGYDAERLLVVAA